MELEDKVLSLDEPVESEAPVESSPIEALASQYGWSSDGEKSAEDFIKVAMDKFPDQSKKIKQLFRAVEEMKVHMSKTEQVAYEKAKRELDNERVHAIQSGDVERVDAIDKARAELPAAIVAEEGLHPAIVEFEERNDKWLKGTSYEELKMQKWISEYGAILGRKKLPVDEHMSILENHLKKEFPSYFNEESEDEPRSPVASARDSSPDRQVGKNKKFTFNDLSPGQKKVARDFEAAGFMKIDAYIKDLIEHGELK